MDAFCGEIRLFPYTFVPQYWLPCDGSTYLIQSYQGLFAVIGFQFGGDQRTNFAVPDLRARVAVGTGIDPTDIYRPAFATSAGTDGVALSQSMMPPHNHVLNAATVTPKERVTSAAGNYIGGLALSAAAPPFTVALDFQSGTPVSPVNLNAGTLSSVGGNATGGTDPHENRQPYLAMQYCICTSTDNFPVRP
jgi:microcystin-dependent protein